MINNETPSKPIIKNDCPNNNFPKMLDINLPVESLIEQATNILIKDFSLGIIKFKGKEIIDQYPHQNKFAFEHVLKLDEKNLSGYNKKLRCIYAPQFKFLLEEKEKKNCPNYIHWTRFDRAKAQHREIILCKKRKLVIVLKEIKAQNCYMLVTAFYANYPNYIESLVKEYEATLQPKA